MELRLMSTAFLRNGDKFLMIKKRCNRYTREEFWSGLGGHLEAGELHSPQSACLREIFEESGIPENRISNLKLRYVLLRMKDGEMRQQFVYFGDTAYTQLIPSEEGELHWVGLDEIIQRRMSAIIRFMMQHYLEHPNHEEVTVGTISLDSRQEPCMHWAELKDPIIF